MINLISIYYIISIQLFMKNFTRLSDQSQQPLTQKQKIVKIGNYTVCFDKLIGRGAFSDVYICKDSSKNIAAVKVINKDKHRKDSALSIAKAQTKILKQLNNDNIVKYLGSYESAGNFYIVLEYCDGKTVKQLIQSKQAMSHDVKLSIIAQLVCILRYLHDKNISHRDLKPDNLKFTKNGRVILLDFGFAKLLEKGQNTITTQWVGTPSYMSPQMLTKQAYNSKSDIWSLGIVIYQLFYGFVPWRANSESELVDKIKKKSVTFPKQPHVSQTIKQLIRCCLVVNPSSRISWKQLFLFDNIKVFKNAEKDQACCKCCKC